jgi:predicted 2-oxoglutarate/Fe(II)-dependent dioxygenase YbiX
MVVGEINLDFNMKDYQIIENLFSSESCQELINKSEELGYEEADISYSSGAKMNKQYRDNMRCLYSDEKFREELQELLKPYIPETEMYSGYELKFLKLSGKFRFYKYNPGQKFKKHKDGNNLEEGGIALHTVLIYLNTPEEGGETGVYDPELSERLMVKAEAGKVLVFNHSVAHTGEELIAGVKYVLRTDFIYELPEVKENVEN